MSWYPSLLLFGYRYMKTEPHRKTDENSSSEQPESLEETLNSFDEADRKLAAFLIITVSWEQMTCGPFLFSDCCLRRALTFLSDVEQRRIAGLLADHLKAASIDTIQSLKNLPKNLKQTAWSQLEPHEQHRIQRLLDAQVGGHHE